MKRLGRLIEAAISALLVMGFTGCNLSLDAVSVDEISLSASESTVKVGTPVSFSVAFGTSSRSASDSGYTYDVYVNNEAVLEGRTDSAFTYVFNSADTYTVKVVYGDVVSNACSIAVTSNAVVNLSLAKYTESESLQYATATFKVSKENTESDYTVLASDGYTVTSRNGDSFTVSLRKAKTTVMVAVDGIVGSYVLSGEEYPLGIELKETSSTGTTSTYSVEYLSTRMNNGYTVIYPDGDIETKGKGDTLTVDFLAHGIKGIVGTNIVKVVYGDVSDSVEVVMKKYTVYVVDTENFCFADDTLRTVLGDGTSVSWKDVNGDKTEATAVLKSGYALSDLVDVNDEGYPHVYNFVDEAYCNESVVSIR